MSAMSNTSPLTQWLARRIVVATVATPFVAPLVTPIFAPIFAPVGSETAELLPQTKITSVVAFQASHCSPLFNVRFPERRSVRAGSRYGSPCNEFVSKLGNVFLFRTTRNTPRQSLRSNGCCHNAPICHIMIVLSSPVEARKRPS